MKKFTAEFIKDRATNWDMVSMEFCDYDDLDRTLTVNIAPRAGSNMYSLRLGKDELLRQAPCIKDLQKRNCGTPVLYPTPGRLRNARFTFNGEKYVIPPNRGKHLLHGLVYDAPWFITKPFLDDRGVQVTTYLDFAPDDKLYPLWPFRHRISLRYHLDENSVKVTFFLENKDTKPIPFSFGLHPFFNYHSSRASTFLCAPVKKRMKMRDLIPDGQVEDMNDVSPDVRKPMALSGLFLNDVYLGLTREDKCWWESRERRIRCTLSASSEFTHLILYTEQPEFFCIENLTSSPNAPNLYNKGLIDEAHLLIAEPGETKEMWVRYKVERLEK